MKRIFITLLGVLTALAVMNGAQNLRNGVSFFDISGYLPQAAENTPPQTNETPTPPSEPEENLTYDQRIEKGNYYYERGFLVRAAQEYTRAAQLKPGVPDPYLLLLETNKALGEFDKARLNAQTILSLDATNLGAQIALLELDLKQLKFSDASTKANDFSQTSNPEVLYLRGVTHLMLKDYQNAEADFNKALTLEPSSTTAHAIQVFNRTFDEYNFAQGANPLYREVLLARTLNELGEYELAIHKSKEVLKERPDLRDAWILLGFGYLNLDKTYFALTAFEKAYQIDPEWPVTPYFMALTYEALDKDTDALLYMRYALQNGFEPASVAKRKLAELYLATNAYQEAATLYVELLQENEMDIASYVRPIWLYLDFLNQPQNALNLATQATQRFPDNAMAYNLYGWSLLGAGQLRDAEENLNKAIALNSNFAAPYYNLGKLYLLQNKTLAAKNAFQKAYELDPTGSIGLQAAQRYNELITQ